MSRGIHAAAAGIAALGAALVLAASASAAPVVDGEFAIPGGVGTNNEITAGPDGNMWVTRQDDNGVARITPGGTVTPFTTTNTATGITVGPDNNLWVTTALGVAEIDPATGAEVDTYDIGLANGSSITAGPDGNLWAVGGDKLVRFSPADPEGTDTPTTITGMSSRGMTTGSDGLLWIADAGGNSIISATADNTPVTTPYPVGAQPQDVAAGAAAQVAYAASGDHEIGLISPGGTPLRIPLATSDPFGVALGADGAYWVARSSKDDLVRLASDGTRTTLTGFSDAANVGPRKIAAGPNNTLWVTLDEQEKVARVTGVEPGGNGGGGGGGGGGTLETFLDKKPKKKLELKGKKRRAKAKFRFSSSDPAANFECKLKRKKARKPAKFKACGSPKTYKLKPGKYRFQVRAVVGDVVDPTPAKAKFKVIRKK